MECTYAAELMRFHDRPIAENMNHKYRFLVRVLHKINREVQIAFSSIYDQMCHTQTAAIIINKNIIAILYAKIKVMFRQIVQDQVADFHLPIELDNNSTREIQNNREEILTNTKKQKRGDRNDTAQLARNLKQKEGLPDLWRLPENADFNSLFSNNAKGNVLVAKISNFKFHHQQKEGRDY